MANGSKKVVRRVKATTTDAPKTTKATTADKKQLDKKQADRIAKAKVVAKETANRQTFILFRPFVAIGRYLRDSWRELRLVEWPSRRATWKMTAGVIIFCIFIGVFVLICDWASQWLIQEVIL